jgi:hypothetical protein
MLCFLREKSQEMAGSQGLSAAAGMWMKAAGLKIRSG